MNSKQDGNLSSAAQENKLSLVKFKGLSSEAFQHPLDQTATENLKKLKGFDWVVKKFIEYNVERFSYIENIGNNIRVGPKQMKKYYSMLQECCDILDMPEPELYVANGPVNAQTSGHNNPYIVLFTGLLQLMPDDAIRVVIAHELGHIKCGHVLYKTMASLIQPIMEIVGQATFGIGNLVGVALTSSLAVWNRRSELSADRAALLAVQCIEPCIDTMMFLSGGILGKLDYLDREQFINQSRTYQAVDDDTLGKFYKYFQTIDMTHPHCVERVHEIDIWYRSPHYEQLISGKMLGATNIKYCPTCKAIIQPGVKFCPSDGTPIPFR